MEISYPAGATPLASEEIEMLIPAISTQGELNELEEENIRQGLVWARRSRKIKTDLLSISVLKLLHQQMFNKTWRWAGTFRKSEKNIGVLQHNIQPEIYKLCGDVKTWIAHRTFTWNEIGTRFHHRLVAIHPFANGNGRHARIAANLLLEQNNQKALTWGSSELIHESELRNRYLGALRKADLGEYEDLVLFAES